jgi:hypothetical protein
VHGLLIERSYKVWSFSHLTFQEYLVAKWFCERNTWHSIIENVIEFRWREVFLLISNILKSPRRFLIFMKKHIDLMVSSDVEIQIFLGWIHQKCQSDKSIRPGIRNLYNTTELTTLLQRFLIIGCSLCLRQSERKSLDKFVLVELLSSSLKRLTIDPDFWSLAANDISLSYKLKFIIGRIGKIKSEHIFLFYLHDLDILAMINQESVITFIDTTYTGNSFIKSNWYGYYPNSCLDIDSQIFDWLEGWENCSNWEKNLREDILRINNSNTSFFIHFNNEKENFLKQFYEASILLNECINLANDEIIVQENIKQELLLPIAEIEKRKRENIE